MRFPEFAMERMQSTWEHRVTYDLSESGIEALTLDEAVRDLAALGKQRIGYANGMGRDETRSLVAAFHPAATRDNVLITTGTSEANFLALATLVEPGDEVVIVMPNYMQLHGVAHGLGATVREVWLGEESGWRIDLDVLRAAVTPRTKAVCVCNPNNPTGQVLTAAESGELAAIVSTHGGWLIADEVYRGAERTAPETATFYGSHDRVIVTGGLSKAYGLPGLRIGWIVAPPERIAAAWSMKDYTTIAPATLSEVLAEIALARRGQLLARATCGGSRPPRERSASSGTASPSIPSSSWTGSSRTGARWSCPARTSARRGTCASDSACPRPCSAAASTLSTARSAPWPTRPAACMAVRHSDARRRP